MSAREITNYYHPVCQTRYILQLPVRYKFKVSPRGEMLFKSKGVAHGTAAHMEWCRITPKILVAAQKSGAESHTYVDSGCAISIINTLLLLVNVRQIKPIVIQGVSGERTINKAGNLHLPAVSNDGVTHTIVVNGVLFNEVSPVNLLSVDQLLANGFSVRFEPEDEHCCIVLNPHTYPIFFQLRCENKIFSIYSPLGSPTTARTVPNA
eukprot:2602569-Rhodomonas_salina.1